MKETIVFIHGMCHGAWCWEEFFIPYFEQLGYHCIAFDLPGHTQQGSTKAIHLSLDDYVNALADIVDRLEEDPIIVGHSMGAQLTVETLRQMDIRDSAKLRSHLAGVVLLSPDIDVEVFKSQVATFGTLPQPFVIISSSKDKALRLSSVITGQPNRLGNLEDIQQLAELDVRVIDVAAFSTGSGHFTIGDSPELIALLSGVAERQKMFGSPTSTRRVLLPGEVSSGQNASTIVLSPSMALPDVADN